MDVDIHQITQHALITTQDIWNDCTFQVVLIKSEMVPRAIINWCEKFRCRV